MLGYQLLATNQDDSLLSILVECGENSSLNLSMGSGCSNIGMPIWCGSLLAAIRTVNVQTTRMMIKGKQCGSPRLLLSQ